MHIPSFHNLCLIFSQSFRFFFFPYIFPFYRRHALPALSSTSLTWTAPRSVSCEKDSMPKYSAVCAVFVSLPVSDDRSIFFFPHWIFFFDCWHSEACVMIDCFIYAHVTSLHFMFSEFNERNDQKKITRNVWCFFGIVLFFSNFFFSQEENVQTKSSCVEHTTS